MSILTKAKKPCHRASHIIDEVKGHEDEINKYNNLWKEILRVVPIHSKIALAF